MKARALILFCCTLLVSCAVQLHVCGASEDAAIFPDVPPLPTGRACTSFLLDADDHPLFGTNRDSYRGRGLVYINKRGVQKRGLKAGTTGAYARWTSRYGSVTFNNIGPEYPWSGMNEAGLAISTMYLRGTEMPAPDPRPPVVTAQWLQYQLDNCSTVKEVIASAAQIRIAPGMVDHHLVCDRTSSCAVIEFLDGEPVIYTGETAPVRALTNSAYAQALASWERAPRLILDESLRRFSRVADLVHGYGSSVGSPLAYAFGILADVGYVRRSAWSIVYDLQALHVYFRTRENGHVRCLDLNAFDMSCTTPIKTLDVDADLSGDVSEAFADTVPGAGLALFWAFCRAERLGLTYAEARDEVAYLEGFPCAVPDAQPAHDDAGRPRSVSCAADMPPGIDDIPLRGGMGAYAPLLGALLVTIVVAYVAYRTNRRRR